MLKGSGGTRRVLGGEGDFKGVRVGEWEGFKE